MKSKQDLRDQAKSLCHGLDAEYRKVAAQRLLINLQPLLDIAYRVGVYHAYGCEISLDYVIEYGKKAGKALYQPIASRDNQYMYFGEYEVDGGVFVTTEFYNDATKCVTWDCLDLILIPLVAVDGFGNRLGKGGGYYDFTLQDINKNSGDKNTILCGVGYHLQLLPEVIPHDVWDVKLNYFVSENELIKF